MKKRKERKPMLKVEDFRSSYAQQLLSSPALYV